MYCTQQYSKRAMGDALGHLEKHGICRADTKIKNAEQTLYQQRQVDGTCLCESIAEWLMDHRHPLVEVQSIKFRKLIKYINPLTVSKIPK